MGPTASRNKRLGSTILGALSRRIRPSYPCGHWATSTVRLSPGYGRPTAKHLCASVSDRDFDQDSQPQGMRDGTGGMTAGEANLTQADYTTFKYHYRCNFKDSWDKFPIFILRSGLATGKSREQLHGQQKLWVAHCPDFLRRLVALIHSMRLSLMKGAHTDLSSVPSLKFVKELLFGFVSGHDFSRAANTAKPNGLQPLRAVSGTFSIPRIVPGTSGTGH